MTPTAMPPDSDLPAGLPCVAIVGRPNVGKSTLFNAIAGRRIAIVEPTRGVTRDRVSATVEHDDGAFELVDTGGIGVDDSDGLTAHIERQIRVAIEQADLILFLVDAHDGLLPADCDIANRLREIDKPVLLVANKVDDARQEPAALEFFRLGLGEPHAVSALHRRGCDGLRDALAAAVPPGAGAQPRPVAMRLAIVGRRNVGKSTFVNALAGEERMIVSEFPGTTRDAVDVRFEKDGKCFVAIDTAGVRKRRRLATSIEFYSMVRARKSIARADVVLLLLDVTQEIVELDKRLAAEVADQIKPCVIVGNKWDLAKGQMATGDYADYLGTRLPMLDYAPLTFTSANLGRRLLPTIELAQQLFKQAHTRAATAQVNQALEQAAAARSPRPRRGRRARLYYATQVDVAPPTIVVFVNDPRLVDAPYKRYLAGALRRALPYPEIPIALQFRPRRRTRRKERPQEP